ncbi:MAG: DUF2203 domain-containing protein [Planctomycetes bacterium]|nr:DUF2203 domain-containing protein [Planctomycetota bacterium]
MDQPQKLFTLAEANKTLPLVRRVIKDIVHTHQQICDLYTQYRKNLSEGRQCQAEDLELEIQGLLESRDEYVKELEQIGCEFKDAQLGLVDFPAQMGHRHVYLCWRMDEPEVRFWHELQEGYAGRQPIDGYFSSEEGA